MTVNDPLTANAQPEPAPAVEQQRVENDAYAAMLRRMIGAYASRVGEADPYDLADALDVAHALEQAIGDAVRRLHKRGYSWQDIGDGAGITRQAAQQRWGR